jgi:hypothetical protein
MQQDVPQPEAAFEDSDRVIAERDQPGRAGRWGTVWILIVIGLRGNGAVN